jgi:hypothetical protein
MAENNSTSLEGVEKPFMESVWYQIWRATSWAKNLISGTVWTTVDLVKDVPEFFTKSAPSFFENAYNRTINFATKSAVLDVNMFWDPLWVKVNTDTTTFTPEEKAISGQMKNISWWEMGWDFTKALWGLGKEAIAWDEVSSNLIKWVDKDTFGNTLSEFQKKQQWIIQEQEKLIADKKYKGLLDFEDQTKAEYLSAKWVTVIDDLEDYSAFKSARFSKLPQNDQSYLLSMWNEINQKLSDTNAKIKESEDLMKTYVDENMYWGYKKYEEVNKGNADKLANNETLKLQWKIYELTTQRVENEMVWLSNITKSADILWFNDVKDAVIDNIAVDYNYELNLLWMDELKWNKELAKKSREINKVNYKMNIEFLNTYIEVKQDKQNKWLSEVDVKNKALKQVWTKLNPEEKRLLRDREWFITWIAQYKEVSQFADRNFKILNPKAYLDAFSFMWDTVQRTIDEAYDVEWDEVPHYIKQETRNLIYANEWVKDKITSSLTYNSDAILSLVGASYLTKLTKAPAALDRFAGKLKTWITKIPLNIAGKKTFATIVGNLVEWVWASQLYWAAVDPVIDNLMMEAPTNTLESFNQISNLLFDLAPLKFKWWKSLISNAVSYEFMHWDKKKAILDFIDIWKLKWVALSKKEAVDFLENWIEWLFWTVFNPKKFADELNTEWGVYNMIKDHVVTMEDNQMKWLLTEWGYALAKDYWQIMWLQLDDIKSLKSNMSAFIWTTDNLKKQILWNQVSQLIKLNEEAFNVWGWFAWNVISYKHAKNPELIQIREEAKQIIQSLDSQVQKWSDWKYLTNIIIEDFNRDVDKLHTLLNKATRQFGTKKVTNGITIKLPNTNQDIFVRYADIEDLKTKNFKDLVKDWMISFKTKDWVEYKDYIYKQTWETYMSETIKSTVKNNLFDIKEFVKKYNNWHDKFNEFFVINKIETLITKWWVTSLDFLVWDKNFNQEILDEFAKLANNIVKDIVWDKHVKKDAIHINDLSWTVMDKNRDLWLASGDLVLDKLSEIDSDFILAYGSFYPNAKFKTDWKLQNAIYLTFWSWILWRENIYSAINDVVLEAKGTMGTFINKVSSIRNEILDFAYSNWRHDIDVWIEKVNTIYSYWNKTDLLNKINNVDKIKVFWLVKTILKDSPRIKQVQEFVFDMFKDAKITNSLEPMIYNLAYKYDKNKVLIDTMMKNLDKAEFKKVFSEILLNKKMADAISAKMLKKQWLDIESPILDIAKNKWEWYLKRLDIDNKKLELEKEKLNDFINTYRGTDVRIEEFEMAIGKVDDRIAFNKKQQKANDTTFLSNAYTEEMSSYMKSHAEDFAWLLSLLDKYKDLFKKEITTMEEDAAAMTTNLKKVKTLSKEDKQVLKIFADKIKWLDFYKATTDQLDWILQEVSEFKWNLKDVAMTVFNAKNNKLIDNTIIIEDIEKILGWYTKESHLLDYDTVMKDNPFTKWIRGFVNDNATNKHQPVTDSIIDFFTWKKYEKVIVKEADGILSLEKQIADLEAEYKTVNITSADMKTWDKTKYKIKLDEWEEEVVWKVLKINWVDRDLFIRRLDDKVKWRVAFSIDDAKTWKALLVTSKVDAAYNLNEFLKTATEAKLEFFGLNKWIRADIKKLSKKLGNLQLKEYKATWIEKVTKFKTIDDLYRGSEEFKTFVNWLYATDVVDWKIQYKAGWWRNMIAELDKLIKNITDKVELNVDRNWVKVNANKKLHENLIKDRKEILRLFKDYRNKDSYKWKYIKFKSVNHKVDSNELTKWNVWINEQETWARFDKIVQIDNMLAADMDSVFFTIWSIWDFWFKKGPRTYNLNWEIRRHKNRLLKEVKTIKDKTQALKMWDQILDLDSPVWATKLFKRIMNGGVTDLDRKILTRLNAKWKRIFTSDEFLEWMLSQSWVRSKLDNGYIFAWNFWDKSSVYQFYKAPKEFTDKIITDKNKFQEWFYENEYAFSNWFIKNNSKITEFKDFKKIVSEHLTESKTFENFKKEIEADEKLFTEWKSTVIETTKAIKKREASTMSNYSTFDDVDIPINTYILEEDIDIPKFVLDKLNITKRTNESLNAFAKRAEAIIEDFDELDIKDILEWTYTWITAEYISAFSKYYNQTKDVKKFKEAFIRTFINDNEDWTSYVTRDLAVMRWEIQWIWSKKRINQMIDEWTYWEFKDHFFGESWNKRFLGKSLINIINSIDSEDIAIDNAVFIWASSAKIQWGVINKWYPKYVNINWRRRRVVWEVSWTTTQYFKNASTDLFKEKEGQTVSDAIKSTLSTESAQKINLIQKNRIRKAFNRLLWDITDPVIRWDIYSEIDKRIAQVSQHWSLWLWSSSILNNKLNDFLTEVSQIINKPKDIWQSMFIKKSSILVGPDEMLISNRSNLYKTLENDALKTLYPSKELSELSKTELRNLKNNIYSVWYRYPVPSKYNTWVYKIITVEENLEKFSEFEWLSGDAVVSNPFSTYLKLEWDNDGDHIFFVSAFKKDWTEDTMWEVIALELLKDAGIDVKKFSDWLDRMWKFNNDFIVAEQVTKDTDVEMVSSLIDSRISALDAKNRIWVVSATGRTIKNLAQMLSMDWQDLKQLIKHDYSEGYAQNIKYSFKDIWSLNKEFNRSFYEKYSSLLQLILDFWNSDKANFDKYWYVDLIWDLLNKTKEWDAYKQADLLEIHEFMTEKIAPLSMMYKNWDKLNPIWIQQIMYELDQSYIWKNLMDKIFPLTWTKRQFMEDFYDDYWNLVKLINTQNNIRWIDNNIFTLNWKPTEFKKLYNRIFKWTKYKSLDVDYLSKKNLLEMSDNYSSLISEIPDVELIKWKTFKEYIKTISSLKYLDNKEKYALKEKLYKEEIIDSLVNLKDTKDWRLYYEAAIMHSIIEWEYKILNLLTNKDKVLNLKFTNRELNNKIDLINKQITDWELDAELLTKITDPNLISEAKYNKDFQKIYNSAIAPKDAAETWVDINFMKEELTNKYDELESISKIERELDEINIMPETKEHVSYELPEISTDITDGNADTMFEVLSWVEKQVLATDRVVTLRVSSIVEKYAPFILKSFNAINDFMNVWDSIRNANLDHIKHFSDSWLLRSKTWIGKILKWYWIQDTWAIWRKIQYELMWYVNWEFVVNKIDDALLTKMKKHFDIIPANLVDKLFKDTKFIQWLEDYSEKVVSAVSIKLNWLESIWYKIHENYKWWMKYSVIFDALESHKWNAQLSLKTMWIQTEWAFRKILWETEISEWSLRILIDLLYTPKRTGMDKIIWYFKNVHYFMTYWIWSIFTWNGIWAGLTQLTPNAIELRAYFNKNYDQLAESIKIMNKYNLLWSESVKEFWSWLWKEMNDWSLINDIWSKAESILSIDNHSRSKDASKMLHMILTNPLWAADYPLENMRKIVAIWKVLNQMWMKDVMSFNKKVVAHWEDFLWVFRHKVREEFADSGGWVVTSAWIYRDTVFSHAHNYFDNFATRFFVQTMWYLMWWSYHKAATWVERELGLVNAVLSLRGWDYGRFKAHMDDWFAYNSMLAKNLMYTTWIYLKLEKYESNPNSHVSLAEFQRWFNNQIVSLEIALWSQTKNWEVSGDLWDWLWDQFNYTTFWMVKQMFRLFKQPLYIKTIFDHHSTQAMLWKEANWAESAKFALDQHYTGYMRYNGLELANDIYNTNKYNSVTNLAWVGWQDKEDLLFDELMSGKIYSRFKDKWFLRSVASYFNNSIMWTEADKWGFAITTEIARELNKIVMDDEDLSALVRWWEIGTWENDYDLSTLIWEVWDKLTEEQYDIIKNIFYKVGNYWFQKKDPITWLITEEYDTKEAALYRDRIEKALSSYWTTFEDMMWMVGTNKTQLLKTLAYLESEHDIPNIIPLSLFFESEKDNYAKIYKETQWKVWPSWYKILEWSQWQEVERDILLKYQDYLNLNWDVVFEVIENHITSKHWDLLDKLEDSFENTKFSKYDVLQLVNKSYLIGQNITEDTNVSRLHSRYALAFKWIWDWDTAVKVTNQFLKWIDELPTLSWKAKAANKAAVLMWMSKSNYNLLSNWEEFNKLTEESKKLLTNRIYKTSKEWIDFDASMYANSVNKAAYWASNVYFPKYRSSSFSWARPNFSKQFAPLQKAMQDKLQYLSPNSWGYISNYNKKTPEFSSFPINNKTFRTKQQYDKFLMQQLFYWYKSKWIIKTYSTTKKVDYAWKKSIKLRAPKKSKWLKEKKTYVSKQSKPYTRWLNPTLPLSMSGGE